MISALEILKEANSRPASRAKSAMDSASRERRRSRGLCLRCGGTRNPESLNLCDACLDLDRNRKPNHGGSGRKPIRRTYELTAGR
jgi:hypothetical protein